ncbi:T9SS type A sorting domain-containing protein [Lewinella sp. 4G2]|uniref:T9SS type A sorting domain-containing protein n=1 Tax=Lewinella sp. 4G2 TaxID=1803372 RepID=UPI0007B4BB26|nr:T9SS type A sorting domain-containing protein [Lewinella sp. 4G2]OAV45292.1 hypothetical protein A3850_012660 [Lewinella sp. 4G2]
MLPTISSLFYTIPASLLLSLTPQLTDNSAPASAPVTAITLNSAANLVLNPGFEDDVESILPWELAVTGSGNGGLTDEQKATGLQSAYTNGNDAYLFQIVNGLTPDTEYVLDFSVYNFKNGGGNIFVGAKNFGGEEVSLEVDDTGFIFVPGQVTFTTGAEATTAEIYLYNSNDATFGWIDDVSLMAVGATSTNWLTEDDGQALLFPNPATEYITLPNAPRGTEYRIFDQSGRVVQQGPVTDDQIIVERLTAGVYYLAAENRTARRFIKK